MPVLSQTRPASLFLWGLLIVAALHPLLYLNIFSGDAEIHLVYGRNFLDGYPLQFNPGQPSSGQTSMGFMFLAVVPAMKLLGETAAPLVMKLFGLFSLYAIAVQTFRLTIRLGLAAPWPLIAAAATLLFPGSIYNGMLGSENAFFGALVLSWTIFALDSGWLSPERPPKLGRDCLLAALMGAMFWIRPETIPFGGLAWVVRLASDIAARKRLDARLAGRVVLFGAIAGAFVLAYVLLFRYWTGILPFGAGYARLLESIDVDSIWIFGVPINAKVVERLGAYASITLPAFYAVTVLARRDAGEKRWLLLFCGVEFFGLMLAYVLNAITALHFARYTIYAWPFGIAAAIAALAYFGRQGGSVRGVVAAAILAFVGMAGYETALRGTFPHDTLVSAMDLPSTRPRASNDLLQHFGNPAMRPVVIATQEVQSRYVLDNRFVIRSLDGILDIVYLNYLCHGYNDQDGYFIDQKVDFVVTPFANYNHDPRRWSLARLADLPVGASITRPGIRYTKINPDSVKVTRLVARSQDRKIQPCAIGPDSPYF